MKNSFETAITRIYFFVVFIVTAGLIVTFFVPERELRKTLGENTAPAPAE